MYVAIEKGSNPPVRMAVYVCSSPRPGKYSAMQGCGHRHKTGAASHDRVGQSEAAPLFMPVRYLCAHASMRASR